MRLGRQETPMNEGQRLTSPSALEPIRNQESFFLFFFFRWCPVGVSVPRGHFGPSAHFWCVCEDETGTRGHPSYGYMLTRVQRFDVRPEEETRVKRHQSRMLVLVFQLHQSLFLFFTFLFNYSKEA